MDDVHVKSVQEPARPTRKLDPVLPQGKEARRRDLDELMRFTGVSGHRSTEV